MTTETPPDWVLLEAAKQCDWDSCDENQLENQLENLRKLYHYRRGPVYRALCDMIQKYEKPPVDRKLLCAREAVGWGTPWATTETIGVHAIELYEEGFGK
jgi:hypothetical protein